MTKQLRECIAAALIGAALLVLGLVVDVQLMAGLGGFMLALALLLTGLVVIRGDRSKA